MIVYFKLWALCLKFRMAFNWNRFWSDWVSCSLAVVTRGQSSSWIGRLSDVVTSREGRLSSSDTCG